MPSVFFKDSNFDWEKTTMETIQSFTTHQQLVDIVIREPEPSPSLPGV